jgi:hypothetical protein
VALTVAAAAGNNIGKVLQKQGTKGLPQLSLDLKVRSLHCQSNTSFSYFSLSVFCSLPFIVVMVWLD